MSIINKKVIFGYTDASVAASTQEGFITFDSNKQAIFVGDGTDAKLVSSNIKDASLANSILTITKIDGTTVQLDLSSLNTTVTNEIGVFKDINNAFNKLVNAVTSVDSNDKILSIENNTISSNLSLSYTDKQIKLLGKDNTEISAIDASVFIKDGMISNVSFDSNTNELTITFNADAGQQAITVNLTDLVDTYTGDNETINVGSDGKISLNKEVLKAIKVNNVAQDASNNIVIGGADISVGGTSSYKDKTIATAINEIAIAIGNATQGTLTSVNTADDSSIYLNSSTSDAGAVTLTIKTTKIKDATESSTGLADAWDVKQEISAAKTALIGEAEDASNAETLYGVKKYVDEQLIWKTLE